MAPTSKIIDSMSKIFEGEIKGILKFVSYEEEEYRYGNKFECVNKEINPEEKSKVFCKYCQRMYANPKTLRVHIAKKHKEERENDQFWLFLVDYGLEEFEDIFEEKGVITFDDLKEMDLSDLYMIGITHFAQRNKIVNAVKSFESEKVHKMSTFEALEDILYRNKIVVFINGREEILIENVKSYEIKIPEFPEV